MLQRKLLKGVVLSALAACFHHLLCTVGSKEIWWQWEGSVEEKSLQALAVAGNRRLLCGKHCKGKSFISMFFPLSKFVFFIPSPPTAIIVIFFHTLLRDPVYWSHLLMFVLLLFLVWSLELNSMNWDSHRLFPHSTSYPTRRLPREGGNYPAPYSLC